MDLDIGISADVDLDAEEAMMEFAGDSRVLADPRRGFAGPYGDSAMYVRLRAYAEYDDFFDLYWDLNRRLKAFLMRAASTSPSRSAWFAMLAAAQPATGLATGAARPDGG